MHYLQNGFKEILHREDIMRKIISALILVLCTILFFVSAVHQRNEKREQLKSIISETQNSYAEFQKLRYPNIDELVSNANTTKVVASSVTITGNSENVEDTETDEEFEEIEAVDDTEEVEEIEVQEERQYVSEPFLVEATCYLATGNCCADGTWPRPYHTLAGMSSWLGRSANLYHCNSDGSIGSLIGTYTFHDTGFGNDPDGDGIGSIQDGSRIDIFADSYEYAKSWGLRNVYVEFLD